MMMMMMATKDDDNDERTTTKSLSRRHTHTHKPNQTVMTSCALACCDLRHFGCDFFFLHSAIYLQKWASEQENGKEKKREGEKKRAPLATQMMWYICVHILCYTMPSNLSEISSQCYAHRIKLRIAIFLLYHSCQLLLFRVGPMLLNWLQRAHTPLKM